MTEHERKRAELKLFYSGFPIGTPLINYELDTSVSTMEKDDKRVFCMITGNDTLSKILYYLFIEKKLGVREVKGYHFPNLFSDILSNETTLSDIQISNWTIVYSIGKELGLKKDFSGALINSIIDKTLLNPKSKLILIGDNLFSNFSDYNIDERKVEMISFI